MVNAIAAARSKATMTAHLKSQPQTGSGAERAADRELVGHVFWAGLHGAAAVDFAARREADLERLADSVEAALDWEKLAPLLPD